MTYFGRYKLYVHNVIIITVCQNAYLKDQYLKLVYNRNILVHAQKYIHVNTFIVYFERKQYVISKHLYFLQLTKCIFMCTR